MTIPSSVQPVRQGQERREIKQGVPGRPVADHVVPVEDPHEHHQRDDGEDHGRRVDPLPGEDPERERREDRQHHHHFLAREASHPGQLCLRPGGNFRTRADLGRIDQVDEQRQGHDQEQTDRQEADDHCDHVISIAVACRTSLSARRFGARAVRNIELVTAVDANAVHIR